MPWINSFPNELILSLLAFASWTDLRTRKIPNALIGLGIFSGLCCLLVYSTVSWQSAVIGFVFGMASLMPFYLLRMLGAGDVKLFGVVGLFLGYELLISVLMSTAIAGGVLAILYLLKQVIINIITKVPITFGIKSLQLPYAVAISLGTLSVLMNLQITL